MALRRQLNAVKGTDYPWMMEVTKNAPQMAIVQLGEAFKNFWAKRAKHPTFRKKGIDDRFTLTNDQFILNGSGIRIPNLGWVRMREPLRFEGKIQSATISRKADRWFICAPGMARGALTGAVSAAVVADGVTWRCKSSAGLGDGNR